MQIKQAIWINFAITVCYRFAGEGEGEGERKGEGEGKGQSESESGRGGRARRTFFPSGGSSPEHSASFYTMGHSKAAKIHCSHTLSRLALGGLALRKAWHIVE